MHEDHERPKFLGLDEFDLQWLITRTLVVWQIAIVAFLLIPA